MSHVNNDAIQSGMAKSVLSPDIRVTGCFKLSAGTKMSAFVLSRHTCIKSALRNVSQLSSVTFQ